MGLIPGLRGSPGVGNGNPLQYFGLGNPMDRRVCARVPAKLLQSCLTLQLYGLYVACQAPLSMDSPGMNT